MWRRFSEAETPDDLGHARGRGAGQAHRQASGSGRTCRCASSSPMPAGSAPPPEQRSDAAAFARPSVRRSPAGLAAGWSIRAIAEPNLGRVTLDGVSGGERQRWAEEVSGPGGRSGGRVGGRCDRSVPSWPSADGFAGWSSASSRRDGRPSRSRRGWLREYPDRPEMQVSHETIYQSLFVQSRGALRKELRSCLRGGRAMRRAKASVNANHIGQGKLKNMVMISDVPAEVADGAVPGHWEGDQIFGKKMTSIGTLVERHSRYVILLKLPNGHGAEAVRKAMTKRILTLPAQLRRSITWDQGKGDGRARPVHRWKPGSRSTSATPRALGSGEQREHPWPVAPIPVQVLRSLALSTQRELDAIAARSTRDLDRRSTG